MLQQKHIQMCFTGTMSGVWLISCVFKYPTKWKHAMIIFANIWNRLRACRRLSGQDRIPLPPVQILKTKALSNVISLSFSQPSVIQEEVSEGFYRLIALAGQNSSTTNKNIKYKYKIQSTRSNTRRCQQASIVLLASQKVFFNIFVSISKKMYWQPTKLCRSLFLFLAFIKLQGHVMWCFPSLKIIFRFQILTLGNIKLKEKC